MGSQFTRSSMAMTPSTSCQRPDAEQGIDLARWLLTAISAAVYFGSRPLDHGAGSAKSGLIAVTILLTPLLMLGDSSPPKGEAG